MERINVVETTVTKYCETIYHRSSMELISIAVLMNHITVMQAVIRICNVI